MIVLAHSGGDIIQGRRVIGRGFFLARREAGITESVEVHLNNILAVFGAQRFFFCLPFLPFLDLNELRATETVTSE